MELEANAGAQISLLKELCRFLDGQRQKNHQKAVEWQNFGRFTAAVLQKEVEGFERKLRVLQEKLDSLVKENTELQEMCFYLDKSRKGSDSRDDEGDKSGRGKLSDKMKSRAPVHSMCAVEMNKNEGPALQYSGFTSENTLHDKKAKKFNILGTKDLETAVTELQKRVEKLESEKLELVKSLSAAHLLATQESMMPQTKTDLDPPSSVKEAVLPPEFQSLLESCRDYEEHTHLRVATSRPAGLNVSADVIMQAVTLLDMCRRLDALEANGFADPLEAAEVATLRVLMSIAWQKLQEESKQK